MLEQFGVFPDDMGRFTPGQMRLIAQYVRDQDDQHRKAAQPKR